MTPRRPDPAAHRLKRIAPAARIGLWAIGLALVTAIYNPLLSALPLLFFLILCFAAPFFPAYGFFLPIVSHGMTETGAVALTFDDGPNPASTPDLLALLATYGAKATFYVNGCRAEKHPELIREILSRGHTIGNHSHSHNNFIMLKSSAALREEIQKTQVVLHDLGVIPYTFRPPVGVTNPKLGKVLEQLDMYTVNFNRRAGDRGNRQVGGLSKKILKNLGPGDIVMLHDIKPRDEKKARRWLVEVERILTGIEAKNLKILPLETLIDRPVMEIAGHQTTDQGMVK